MQVPRKQGKASETREWRPLITKDIHNEPVSFTIHMRFKYGPHPKRIHVQVNTQWRGNERR